MATQQRMPNINTPSPRTLTMVSNRTYRNNRAANEALRQVVGKTGSTYYIKEATGKQEDNGSLCIISTNVKINGQERTVKSIMDAYPRLFEYPGGLTLKDPSTMTPQESENYISFYPEYKSLNPYERWLVDNYDIAETGFTINDIAKDFPYDTHTVIGRGLSRFCTSTRMTSSRAMQAFNGARYFEPGQRIQVYKLRDEFEIPLYYILADIVKNENDQDDGDDAEEDQDDDAFYGGVYGLKYK